MGKSKRIVTMNRKEERKRTKSSLNLNLNPNLKVKRKRMPNLKKSQNASNNDI
jgi:hypothetical protein